MLLLKPSDKLPRKRWVGLQRLFHQLTFIQCPQVGLGNRMDLVFLNIRIGLFHNDHTITTANIAKAKQMLEEGGDWDRRNRLKVRIENILSLQ